MLMLIGIASHTASAPHAASLESFAMGLFAVAFVLLVKAACLICRSPDEHIHSGAHYHRP
jgi:hypothetical protein